MKLISFLFLVSLSLASKAQIEIKCLRLVDSSLNYLYIGVDNPIEISGIKGLNNYRVSITGGLASLIKVDQNKYIVRVSSITDSCEISIVTGSKKIFNRIFNVRTIPNPIVELGGFRDTALNRKRILANPFLSLRYPGCYFKFETKVKFYDAVLVEGIDTITTSNRGHLLSKEQIEFIKNAQSGSRVYFHNIIAFFPRVPQYEKSFWITIE